MDNDPSTYYTSWRFAQGFILGQIFVIAVIIVVVRYFLFEDASSNFGSRRDGSGKRPVQRGTTHARISLMNTLSDIVSLRSGIRWFGTPHDSKGSDSGRHMNGPRETSDTTAHDPPHDLAGLFTALGLDDTQPHAESCQWVNLLVAHLFTRYRSNPSLHKRWIRRVTRWINDPIIRPAMLSSIHITGLQLGTAFPQLKQVKIIPQPAVGTVQWHCKVEFTDHVAVGLDTKILVNWPKPSLAALPISLLLSLTKFTGTVVLEFDPRDAMAICVSVLPEYQLELDTQSLIGHRAKVQNLPKVRDLIVGRVKAEFHKHLVSPAFKVIQLPTFVYDTPVSSARLGSKLATLADNPGTSAYRRPRPTSYQWVPE
ncbi:ERMES complex subunit mmm1 [Dispira parvispora]|uniref:Maintenance of mitochondrial morphology protein 1 n=1 Tax=Dispira parvispora TaxID=1520584 RepID=A0A9W8E1Q3_9FUNG|nr:ERMES complex subunit mmm1 [Dispira parvispora]